MITKDSLVADLRNLGVHAGDILNVKMSYKSIGKVEGGINTVVDALLEAVGSEGTIVSDSFVLGHLPFKMWLSPQKCLVDQNTPSYAGALANVLIKHPLAKRSPHPIQKFVAIGKHADIVLEHNADSAPYSTLHKMAEMGAKNIRIGGIDKVVGVGTTHVAYGLLGWKQRGGCSGVVHIENGKMKRFYHFWPSACPTAVNNLIPLYREFGGIIGEGKVGEADAMLTDFQKTLDMEIKMGKQFPYFTKCQDPACQVCRLQWPDSKGSPFSVIYHNLKRKKLKSALKTIWWMVSKKETR